MSTQFRLDERLAADTHAVGELPLSRLLMMDDANYPWFVLVPRIAGLREPHELAKADRHRLSDESAALSRALLQVFGGDKLNIAAIGNLVPQLHLHHIVRRVGDACWPKPVWGQRPRQPLDEAEARRRMRDLADALRAQGQAIRRGETRRGGGDPLSPTGC